MRLTDSVVNLLVAKDFADERRRPQQRRRQRRQPKRTGANGGGGGTRGGLGAVAGVLLVENTKKISVKNTSL